MRPVSFDMLQYLSWYFQVGDRSPALQILAKHPVTGDMMTIDRIKQCDLDRQADAPAHEATFVVDNSGGWMSPDYKRDGTTFDFPSNRGYEQNNPWVGVMMPNTRIEIHMGYGEELYRVFTGLIDNVSINAEQRTISIKCRSLYKRLLVETVRPPKGQTKIVYKNKSVKYIVDDIHKRMNMPIVSQEIPILGGTQTYIVPELELERGSSWDSFINDLVTSTDAYIGSDYWGRTILKPMRNYKQSDPEDIVLDETINIKELEYNIDDIDIKTDLLVKYNDKVFNHFQSYSLKKLAGGQYREEIIDVPWANSFIKRKQAAQAYFRKYKRKFRTVTVGTVGNPAIELFDLARVYEHTSQATAKYSIKGIRTTFSDMGYFELLDLEHVLT